MKPLEEAQALVLAACGDNAPSQSGQPGTPGEQAQPVVESTAVAPGNDKTALVNEAKHAVKTMGGQLQAELQNAMKAGGPANAIEVCHTVAPELANRVSAQKNLTIRRVSARNRNPVMGVPSDWQAAVLADEENSLAFAGGAFRGGVDPVVLGAELSSRCVSPCGLASVHGWAVLGSRLR